MALKKWSKKGFAAKTLGDGGTTDMWTASGSGTSEYYYNQTDLLHIPLKVYEGTTELNKGTLGSLAAGEWAWGDNDSIGHNTLYVRTSGDADPDTVTITATDAYEVVTGITGTAIIIGTMITVKAAADVNLIITDASDTELFEDPYSFDGKDGAKVDTKVVIPAGYKLKVQSTDSNASVYFSGDES